MGPEFTAACLYSHPIWPRVQLLYRNLYRHCLSSPQRWGGVL